MGSSARPQSQQGLFELASPSQAAFAATKLTGIAKVRSVQRKAKYISKTDHTTISTNFGTDKGSCKKLQEFQHILWSSPLGRSQKARSFTMEKSENRPLEEACIATLAVEAWSIVVPDRFFLQQSHQARRGPRPRPNCRFQTISIPSNAQQVCGIDFPSRGCGMDEAETVALLWSACIWRNAANQDGAGAHVLP